MTTTEETDIIQKFPIEQGLAAFYHQFESFRTRLGFVGSSDIVFENVLSTEFGSG
jgi:hypothetical protein